MKKQNKKAKGFTLIELLVVISIIGILAGLTITTIPTILKQVHKFQTKMYMRELYKLFLMYSQDYNSYPTVSSDKDRFDKSDGVRGLYPLFSTDLIKAKDLNKLFHPPGTKLIDFSSDPSIDEFDKDHIGYAYNSTAIPNDEENPPLLSEQGVSSGMLDISKRRPRGTRSIRKNGVLVLFVDGTVDEIHADRKGKLDTKRISADMWGRLVD